LELRTDKVLVPDTVTDVAHNNHLLFLFALSAFNRFLDMWLRNRLNRVLRIDSLWWIAKLSLDLLRWVFK
jgi:hypothetical protein